ncbi:MAG: hypothetical protein KGD57_03410 [Candidatus Lokiarchaeota archaeon]|nr:hypothetical protein [Candidatus Lokiarchaeota archaeon]
MTSEKENQITGIGLISGGLDSLIATLVLRLQNINIIGLNFKSPFCVCDKAYKNAECGLNLYKEKFNIDVIHLQKEDDYLDIVRNPKFGYGKNLNPCIDCRIYILKKAKEFAEKNKADFIYTGEVLEQRPKSQNKQALEIVEKESNLEGILLRPLSAKLLKPTILENKGLINRSELFGIRGRSRKIQLELARKYNILNEYFACGGCLLTDKAFAIKAKDLINNNENLKIMDFNILKYGRHFRYKTTKIIVGRNELENNMLQHVKKTNDLVMTAKDAKGPVTIIQGDINDDILNFAGGLTLRYADFSNDQGVVLYRKDENETHREITVNRVTEELYKPYIL